jgi:hypothetical protein
MIDNIIISKNHKKIYINADKNKALLLKENKNKTGIYRGVNLINGKSYIGSAFNLKERFISYYYII